MLRRGRPTRRVPLIESGPSAEEGAVVDGEPLAALAGGDFGPLAEAAGATSARQLSPTRRRRWFSWKRLALAVLAMMVAGAAVAYPFRSKFTAQGADLSRKLIGDENTARIEALYFRVDDRVTKVKYRLLGGDTNPFGDLVTRVDFVPKAAGREIVYIIGSSGRSTGGLTADALGPAPMVLPATIPLRDNLEAGEGVWTTAGLPRSSPGDVLMAKTFVRPDKTRPYALVGVLCLDARRIRLNMVGGTGEPGGARGIKGAGVVPRDAHSQLLIAFTGGFKGPHGNYGMYADGKTYLPMRNGLATIAVLGDGTIKMGEWGRDLAWDDSMVAVRQNAVLLVDKGEISRRVSEGNDTWGYVAVNSAEFITWRSAVGMTKEGNLLVAAGNSLSAETLAKALWAAGAYWAMQLDINSPYVLTGLYTPQPDGSLRAEKFMDAMPDNPARFLKPHERDLMYVVLDETKYR